MKEIVRHYTANALKELKSLDKSIANRIVEKVRVYSEDNNPLSRAKALTGSFSGMYRY